MQWLLGRSPASAASPGALPTSPQIVEDLLVETAELQAQFDALRAAERHERGHSDDGPLLEQGGGGSHLTSPDGPSNTVHFEINDEGVPEEECAGAMYDFSRLSSQERTPATLSSCVSVLNSTTPPCSAAKALAFSPPSVNSSPGAALLLQPSALAAAGGRGGGRGGRAYAASTPPPKRSRDQALPPAVLPSPGGGCLPPRELSVTSDSPSSLSTPGSRRRETSAPTTPNSASEDLRRLRAAEKRLRQRGATLEAGIEAQERRLEVAARTMQKSRSQAKQLTAQLGLRELDESKLSEQVSQLREQLVERERLLQDALDGAERASARAGTVGGDAGEAAEATPPQPTPPDEVQQPQEGPTAVLVARAPDVDEQQVQQLAQVTEQLTDALETARECEQELRDRLERTAAELREERAMRAARERGLTELQRTRDAEVATLLAEVAAQEQRIAGQRARARALEEALDAHAPHVPSQRGGSALPPNGAAAPAQEVKLLAGGLMLV